MKRHDIVVIAMTSYKCLHEHDKFSWKKVGHCGLLGFDKNGEIDDMLGMMQAKYLLLSKYILLMLTKMSLIK